MVVLQQGLVADDFHELHHTAVFMSQNVAMQNEDAGEINKPAANLHISRDVDLLAVLVVARPFPFPLAASKFAIVDLGATLPIRIRTGATMQVGVKNLLDRNYYYWEGFPEEGRSWYMTLRYEF